MERSTHDGRAAALRARAQVARLRQFYIHLTVYILVNAFLTLISLANRSAWSIWPLLGWGIGLAAHAVTVFVGGGLLGADWEERQIRRQLEREKGTWRWGPLNLASDVQYFGGGGLVVHLLETDQVWVFGPHRTYWEQR
ncbi:MAG: 2TM domain-containing protein [Chloroflexales bacterium]|nr:2TM domain-containing protein [Chloroflexales bacterium]